MIIQNGTIEFKTKTAGGIDLKRVIPSNRLPWHGANLFHVNSRRRSSTNSELSRGNTSQWLPMKS